VELLFEYVDRLRTHFEAISHSHDLTPVQAKLLLSMNEPAPMRCVADALGCDPSNVTGVVDRLEERGLVTRAECPADRRAKFLNLTATGRRQRDAFVADLFREVPGMASQSPQQIASLREALMALCRMDQASTSTREDSSARA
jgi:DNA-binding MarR family transcriptional regulator